MSIPKEVEDNIDESAALARRQLIHEIYHHMGGEVKQAHIDMVLSAFCDVSKRALAQGKIIRLVNFVTIRPEILKPRVSNIPNGVGEVLNGRRLKVRFVPSVGLRKLLKGVRDG